MDELIAALERAEGPDRPAPYSKFQQCMDTLDEINTQLVGIHTQMQSIIASLKARSS